MSTAAQASDDKSRKPAATGSPPVASAAEPRPAMNMQVGELLAMAAALKEVQQLFAPTPAPPDRRERREFADDDLDELIDENAPDYWEVRAKRAEARQKRDGANGKKERRKMWMTTMMLNFGATLLLNLVFNWTTTVWWVDQNVRPRVDSFGFETYVDDFDHWTAAEEALVQLKKEKDAIDIQLDANSGEPASRISLKRKSEELFDVIKTLEANVGYYGDKLESRNKLYGHGVTPKYMIEQAGRRRGQIIE